MLSFVLGRSLTGKTTYIMDKICTLAKSGEKKLLLIVPDQSSFDTEKKLLQRLGSKLSGNVLVFGFSRLCDYIFSRTKKPKMFPLDEGTRNVILSLAIEQVKEKLSLYKEKADTKDVLLLMSSSVKEYKKCGVFTDELRGAADFCTDTILRQKLYDTSLVCDAYDALLQNTYLDPLDRISLACQKLKESKLFSDYTVCIDSYSGFTYTEKNMVEELMLQSRDMFVSLVYDSAGDEELFFVTNRTKRILSDMANRNGIKISRPVELFKQYIESDEIKFLDRNLFSAVPLVYDKKCENIKLFIADNIYKEVEFCANEIKKLVLCDGLRYNDIAVIVRELTPYNGIIDTCFKNNDIFYFSDVPQNIENKPLIKLIIACFEAVLGYYKTNSVLEILKCGLLNFSDEDISAFENYVFVWNISGKKFLSEFTDSPRGFGAGNLQDDSVLLEHINGVRQTLFGALESFKEKIKEASGKAITTALYELFTQLNIEENIISYCEKLKKQNFSFFDEQIRLWDILIDIFDRTVDIIGDTQITAKRYLDLLLMQIQTAQLSQIPQTFDGVTVATADRVRLQEKKEVFVLGAIEGQFPRNPVASGVFNDIERKTLLSYDIHLDDDIEKLYFHEKLLAYTSLTGASQKLYVSFYTSTLSGESVSPSQIVGCITESFKDIVPVDKYSVDFTDRIWTKKSAFKLCAENFYSTDEKFVALKEYLIHDGEYSDKMKKLCDVSNRKPFAFDDPNNAKRLFPDRLNVSASQIESFYLCRFSYFCRYGVGAKERKKAQIDSLEYGTLMHYILERFLKENDKEKLCCLDEEKMRALTDGYLENYLDSRLGGRENKSERFLYLFERIKDTAFDLMERLKNELLQSDFVPVDFELKIGEDIKSYRIDIDKNRSITIYGSIDRADIMELDGKKYIRVIDYKTGAKKFNLSDVLYGLNLQMLVYLSAVVKNGGERYGGNLVPAGVLYMPAISPIINADSKMSDEKIESERQKGLVMNGLVLDDARIIRGMEENAENMYIPVKLSNGEVKAGKDSLLSLEAFGAVFKRLEKLAAEMSDSLTNGEIAALPAKQNKSAGYDACAWCPYKSVCNFDEETSPVRNIYKFDKQRVLDELYKDTKGGNEHGQKVD